MPVTSENAVYQDLWVCCVVYFLRSRDTKMLSSALCTQGQQYDLTKNVFSAGEHLKCTDQVELSGEITLKRWINCVHRAPITREQNISEHVWDP